MRVLIIQKRFHNNTRGIVAALQRRGHEVAMIVHHKSRTKRPDPLLEPEFVPYLGWSAALAGRRGAKAVHRRALPNPRRLWHVLRTFRPQVVVIKKPRLGPLLAAQLARILGARWVLWRNRPPDTDHRLKRLGARLIGHIGSITTTVRRGEAPRNGLIRGARFLPYPIELPPGRPPGPPRPGRAVRVLCVVSYGNERKRPEWLVHALADAYAAGGLEREVTLTFVGGGKPQSVGAERVRAAAAERGLSDAVTLEYSVPYHRMNEIYAAHDLFVLPSRDEPFGMVVLEAMANGLAVICSDTVWSKCCFVEGESGLVFATESRAELRDHLARLCGNPSELAAYGAAARRRVAEHYTLEAWVQTFEEVVYSGVSDRVRSRLRT